MASNGDGGDILHPIGQTLRYQIDDGRGYREVHPDPDGDLHVLGCSDERCTGCWWPHSYERSVGAWFVSVPRAHPTAVKARVVGTSGVIERRVR
jgi:hypothetical protein